MNRVVPRIDICIVTYKRPDFLRKLLVSLQSQYTAGKFSYDIIVSDNDRARSGEAIVKEFAGATIGITYDVEPIRNISLNRNRTLSHATGDYIAILDDDQYVGTQWLLNLYNTLVSCQADVAFGAVIPVFEQNASLIVRKSAAFGVANFPEGCTDNVIYHTGNCCFRSEVILGMPAPFDSTLGDRAGEDTQFFEALRRRGCKMVWSQAAVCYEQVPPHRARLSWFMRRYFETGYMLFPTCGEHRACEILCLFRPLKHAQILVRIVMAMLMLPACAALSLVNHHYIPHAVSCLRRIAMYLGCSYYLLCGKFGA
jgi:succinoglycan biosynthesis protein ExoM